MKQFARRKMARSAAVGVMAATVLTLSLSPAFADPPPGKQTKPEDALLDCSGDNGEHKSLDGEWYKSCAYHVVKQDVFDGAPEKTNTFSNCEGKGDLTHSFSQSIEFSQSKSHTQSGDVNVGAALGSILSAGLKGSDSWTTTWGKATTSQETISEVIKPNEKAWLEFTPKMIRSSGWLEVQYYQPAGDTNYFWTVNYPTVGGTGFVTESPEVKPKTGFAVGSWTKKSIACDASEGTTPKSTKLS
ncbi:hypothetical protein [Streptomyces sioyaensis]|uniref:hypothetical protein n=1 Tax=Streptomyces sioyaensis TaxID=67364 RepID=UPI0036EB584A